jgi:glycosyltransferase involved in cell wall biosynthesis
MPGDVEPGYLSGVRVLRIYHAGRSEAQRARERALHDCGVQLTLVVPSMWPGEVGDAAVGAEDFEIVELPVRRSGDVNRHRYDEDELAKLIRQVKPAVLDVHEEPFSVASHQLLRATPTDLPTTMYAAQNIDKRFPPPFAQFERAAYRRVTALYPCSKQAASVSRGKGYDGLIEVLPLGYDPFVFEPGCQSVPSAENIFGFFGRLVPEKGVIDAIEVLARCNQFYPARLLIVGDGPEQQRALARAHTLGVSDRVEFLGWKTGADLASTYRRCHVVLVTSKSTLTWVEQFGRVIVEAQASGAIVAAYNSGSIGEVAADIGLVVEVGDVGGLARRISDLLGSPVDFVKLQRGGLHLSGRRRWATVARRHAHLYESALRVGRATRFRPSSPSARRKRAQDEFGSPATALAGTRPFAVPLLRRGGRLAAVLAWALDAASEHVVRFTAR